MIADRTARSSRAAGALLSWFHARERDVPWRGDRDPYRVWVAEVMTQQTRIETVRPYYERFVQRFPTVETLASAPIDDVLKLWEGLGYYRRARHLHMAAGLVTQNGGQLPADPEGLRALPGIGPYTAGAIASLAFGLPEPAVDGNARRVLARLFDLERPNGAAFDGAARDLLSAAGDQPAELNQAIMDLGSSVCSPRQPSCGACPLAADCLAHERGTVALRPARRPTKRVPHRNVAVAAASSDGRFLMVRRPEGGLLGGLWDLPGDVVENGESARRTVSRVFANLGLATEVGERFSALDHAFSHLRITLYAFRATCDPGRPAPSTYWPWQWATPEELRTLAIPVATGRALESIGRTPQDMSPPEPSPPVS